MQRCIEDEMAAYDRKCAQGEVTGPRPLYGRDLHKLWAEEAWAYTLGNSYSLGHREGDGILPYGKDPRGKSGDGGRGTYLGYKRGKG